LPYLLAFCRLSIGFLFLYSFLAKVRDTAQFTEAITHFKLLPSDYSQPLALLFLAGEAAVVLLIILGGLLLPLAFGLAGLLLLTFTLALLSALRRNIQTACNCLGPSDKPLTQYDIWRNTGFIVCSLLGWWLETQGVTMPQQPNWFELALVGFMAILFVFVWTQLSEVAVLLANQK
jgi:uncharacterized membrane protein YphA (DoxX/SURF4 family)